MHRKVLIIIVFFIIFIVECATYKIGNVIDEPVAEESWLSDTICQEQVNQIKALQDITYIPKNDSDLIALRKIFKINNYFTVLKNISVEENWNLDFIYGNDISGCSPIIVPYQKLEDYLTTIKKYKKKYESFHIYTNEDYWMHIVLNGTKESYFEYVVLSILGAQFSLFWHAKYNDIIITCTKEEIKKTLVDYRLGDRLLKKASLIDPTPYVVINDKQTIVRIMIFTEWGGFIERKYYIKKTFPHKIEKIKEKILVKYNCGKLF